jgi:hypothetical protein
MLGMQRKRERGGEVRSEGSTKTHGQINIRNTHIHNDRKHRCCT